MGTIRNISSFKPFKQEPNGITAKYWIKVDKRNALYKESKYPSELKEVHDRLEANRKSGTPLSKKGSNQLNGIIPRRTKEALTSNTGKHAHVGEEPIKFHVAEYVYSQLCRKIGIPCAKIEIVRNKRRIGCLSYDVREDISGIEFSERYILNSIDKIISNAEETYSNDTSTVKETGEKYSLELIERSLRKIKNINPEEADKLVKQLISVCLMDCLTNYNDRHTKNFGIVFDKKTGKAHPIGSFDNGECLALRLSQQEMKAYISGVKDYKHLMDICQSRIGSMTVSFISFDELLDHVFFYYFKHADETAKNIIENCKAKNINEIVDNIPGPNLDKTVKDFIKKELQINTARMSEKYNKYKILYDYKTKTFESGKSKDANNLWASIIRKVDNNVDFDENIFEDKDLNFLKYLQGMQEGFSDDPLTDFDKETATYAFLYAKINQSLKSKEKDNYTAQRVMNKLFQEELGIPNSFIYQIAETAKNFQMDVAEMDSVKMKMIIDGYSSKAVGVRISNQTLLLYKCRALTECGRDGYQDYLKMVTKYKEMNELSKIMRRQKLEELFVKDGEPYGVLKEYGIIEKEDILRTMFGAIKKIKKSEVRFKTASSLVNYVINSAKETFKGKKTCIKKWFYDDSELTVIKNNTVTLANKEKFTASFKENIKDFDTKAIRLGYSYVFITGTRLDGEDYFAMTFRNKREVPKELIERLKVIEERATDKNTNKVNKKKFFRREKENGEIKYVITPMDDDEIKIDEDFIKSCLTDIVKNCRRPDMEH